MLTMNSTLIKLDLSGNDIEENVMEYMLDFDIEELEIANYNQHFQINRINRELYINQHPNEFINEINMKYKKRLKKYNIDWKQRRSIHRQYPLNFRQAYRAITPLIALEQAQTQTQGLETENILPPIPREIWITQIIPYLAQSYID